MDINNNDIVTRLKAGDIVCFENIYRRYFPALSSFASQYISVEDAESIVQDTMLWLWENKSSLIPDMSLKSLLFTIVKNKALNKISQDVKRSKIHEAIAGKYEQEFNDPDFYLENELFDLIEKATSELPESYKTAFNLSRIEQKTHKEIAELLDVSHQTINYRIGQAIKLLKEKLKDYIA